MSRQDFYDRFQKTYKDEAHINSADQKGSIVSIPTGILSFDTATGIGGFPRGHVVEVFGPESGGKSLLTLVAVAYAQKIHDAQVLYLDIEGGTPREWLTTLGIDLPDFDIISAGLTAEENLDAIIMAIESRTYDYIIIDSVAGLVPRDELEGKVDQNYMAVLARAMSKGVKKIVATLGTIPDQEAPCVIFINQIRERPGVLYGNPETCPGGKALLFYSAQRYRVTRKYKSEVKENGDVAGHSVVVTNVKNKLGPPKREGEFFINYTKGVDLSQSIMNMVKQRKLYTKLGQKYTMQLEEGTEPILFNKVEDITTMVETDQAFQSRVYAFLMNSYIGTRTDDIKVDEDENNDDDFDKI